MPKRRSSSRKKPKRRTPRRKAHPNGTTLLVVDQKPFLRKAVTACRRLRTELHKKQQLLSQFEEQGMGAYNRWLSKKFGVDLTRIRELQEEVDDLDFILEQLRMCEMYYFEKLTEVHEELFRRKQEGTLHLFVPPQPESEEDDETNDERDAFDSLFEEMFGSDDEMDEEGFENPFSRHSSRRPGNVLQAENAPVKSLYRTLAKRLHPDHSDLEEGMRERRWDELQKAYHQSDLDELQRIEAVCDMDESGLSVSLGLARLRDLAAYHQSHLRPIRQALKGAKRHPAFGFSENNTTSLAKEIRKDFKSLKYDLKNRIHWLNQSAEEILEDAACDEDLEDDNFEESDINEWFDNKLHEMTATTTVKKPKQNDTRQMEFF